MVTTDSPAAQFNGLESVINLLGKKESREIVRMMRRPILVAPMQPLTAHSPSSNCFDRFPVDSRVRKFKRKSMHVNRLDDAIQIESTEAQDCSIFLRTARCRSAVEGSCPLKHTRTRLLKCCQSFVNEGWCSDSKSCNFPHMTKAQFWGKTLYSTKTPKHYTQTESQGTTGPVIDYSTGTVVKPKSYSNDLAYISAVI